ncbi:uncharacterized protein LOC142471226 isoform X2 [Ascaphus truei]|uniref:uncharacterized protein LOC142471226 isoform X2 n=1 Tax=Ascaphus truei TaxID=8439 RepID=UPI003F59E570
MAMPANGSAGSPPPWARPHTWLQELISTAWDYMRSQRNHSQTCFGLNGYHQCEYAINVKDKNNITDSGGHLKVKHFQKYQRLTAPFLEHLTNSLMRIKDQNPMAEAILNHTLEIIFLLTGEDYIVVKKHAEDVLCRKSPSVHEALSRTQSSIMELPTISLTHGGKDNKKLTGKDSKKLTDKVLEHTNKIIHLLTGEVPFKCDDVAVYFSMEEWEYLEGHKELYRDVMMEDHQTLCSLDFPDETRPSVEQTEMSVVGDHQDTTEEEISKNVSIEGEVPLTVNIQEPTTPPPPIHWTVDHNYNTPCCIKVEPPSDDDTWESEEMVENISMDSLGMDENEDQLKIIKEEPEEKINVCLECAEKYNDDPHLATVQRIPSGEDPFTCNICLKNIVDDDHVERHQKVQPGDKSFPCSECGKIFRTNSHLLRHQKTHNGDRPYPCPICGKTFARNAHVVEHQRIHTGEKPYECTECGRKFTNNSHLILHKVVHTREKPYACAECGKRFTRNSSVVKHRSMHAEKKPHVCTECGKSYCQYANLVVHQRLHSGEKPYACTDCSRSFICKASMVRHQRTHSGEKPFSCNQCEKSFSDNSSLNKHKRVHAREHKTS